MLFDDSYNIPANASQGIYKAKGSKFIAYAFPVFSEDEIKKHLEKVRKKEYAARHWYQDQDYQAVSSYHE